MSDEKKVSKSALRVELDELAKTIRGKLPMAAKVMIGSILDKIFEFMGKMVDKTDALEARVKELESK